MRHAGTAQLMDYKRNVGKFNDQYQVEKMRNGKYREELFSMGEDLDWGREPVPGAYSNKRSHVRMNEAEFSSLFDMEEMLVTLTTDKETFTDHLLNISEGGLAVQLPTSLSVNHSCNIRMVLGEKFIFSKAKVCQIKKIGKQFVTGLRFVDLATKSAEYIGGSIYIKALLSRWAIDFEPEDLLLYREGHRTDFFANSGLKRQGHLCL